MSIDTSRNEMQREKRISIIEHLRTVNNFLKCTICLIGIAKNKKERTEDNIFSNNDWELFKINDRHSHRFKKLREHQAK